MTDYTAVLQSKKRALDITIKLFGEEHSKTADSYHSVGVTQHSLRDYIAALKSKKRALDITFNWLVKNILRPLASTIQLE